MVIAVEVAMAVVLGAVVVARTGMLVGRVPFDRDLRASVPPAGVRVADLSSIDGVAPPFPQRADLRGQAGAVVATCIDCRSGDVLGQFLARLEIDAVPDGADVRVVAWDGDAAAWARRWRLPRRVIVHAVSDGQARQQVQSRLHAGESGVVLLRDRGGRWAGTYHLGQVDADDLVHDLRVLARA